MPFTLSIPSEKGNVAYMLSDTVYMSVNAEAVVNDIEPMTINFYKIRFFCYHQKISEAHAKFLTNCSWGNWKKFKQGRLFVYSLY